MEISKSQGIRLVDVLLLGPLMIYWSYKKKLSATDKTLLMFFGITTIGYNARNYYLNLKQEGQI